MVVTHKIITLILDISITPFLRIYEDYQMEIITAWMKHKSSLVFEAMCAKSRRRCIVCNGI